MTDLWYEDAFSKKTSEDVMSAVFRRDRGDRDRDRDRDLPAGGREEAVSVTSDRYQISISPISDTTPFPSFSKPLVVGCFSLVKADRLFVEGPAALKFCPLPKSPNVNLDLNRYSLQNPNMFPTDAEEEATHQETSELTHLLNWIHRHEERFKRRRPHFVFYRGLMTQLLCTPYENQDSWKICAMSKNGTIYLRNMETPEGVERRKRFQTNARLKRTTLWGRAFEYLLLSDDPVKKQDPAKAHKLADECNMIFHTKLGQHDLLYAAEIDAVLKRPGDDSNPRKRPELLLKSELVELKTTRQFPNGQMTHAFRRHNLRKWWCQSFTVGVSQILMGLRDDEGVVHEMQLIPLEMLPKLASTEWSSTVCFNFLDVLLTEIKKAVNGDETCVYVIEFKPERKVQGRIVLNVEVEAHSDKMLHNTL